MVVNAHGYRTDLTSMRSKFSSSIRGTTVRRLSDMVSTYGFECQALGLGVEHLAHLALPCILHWDENHFVVLASMNSNTAVIHDPGQGKRRIAMSDVEKHFSGVAIQLTPGSKFVRQDDRTRYSMFDLVRGVDGLGKRIAPVIALGVLFEFTTEIGANVGYALRFSHD